MMISRYTLLSLIAFCFSAQSLAGVVIGGTRIVYPSDKKEVQITLKNKDNDERHLVQSWISDAQDKKAPFIVTPPLIKLDEKKETLLHVVYTGEKSALPSDRETLFWANVKSIAATPVELKDKNHLQLAFKTRVKLFWRPGKLNSSDAGLAAEKLTFARADKSLKVTNPTPYYVSFETLTVDGKKVASYDKTQPDAATMMVAPFSTVNYPLPEAAGNTVSWTAINDYGGTTPVQKAQL